MPSLHFFYLIIFVFSIIIIELVLIYRLISYFVIITNLSVSLIMFNIYELMPSDPNPHLLQAYYEYFLHDEQILMMIKIIERLKVQVIS